jgi:hypothetical protein
LSQLITDTPEKRPSRGLANFALGLGSLAFLWSLFLAWRYFLALPVYDYWDVLAGSYQFLNASFSEHISFYWAPFVDQKMVFPKMMIDRLAQWTGNRHYGLEIVFGLVSQLFVVVVLWGLGRETDQWERNRARLGVGLALLFWPYLAFRFQHHWYSTQYSWVLWPALAALGLFFKRPGSWATALLTVLLVGVSSLSHGTGLFLAIALLPAICFSSGWSRTQRWTMGLSLAAFVVMVLSEMPPKDASATPGLLASLDRPLFLLKYFLACFGPQIHRPFVGSILLGLAALGLWRLWQRGELFSDGQWIWNTVVIWALLVGLGTALARSSYGGQPSANYFSFFVLFVYAVFELLLRSGLFGFPRFKVTRVFFIGLIVYGLIIYVTGIEKGLRHVRVQSRNMQRLRQKMRFCGVMTSKDLGLIFPHPRFRKLILPLLHRENALDSNINLQIPELKSTLKWTWHPKKNELRINLSRVLRSNELIECRGLGTARVSFTWRVGDQWHSDRYSQINRAGSDPLWIRPSLKVPAGSIELRIKIPTNIAIDRNGLSLRRWSRPD